MDFKSYKQSLVDSVLSFPVFLPSLLALLQREPFVFHPGPVKYCYDASQFSSSLPRILGLLIFWRRKSIPDWPQLLEARGRAEGYREGHDPKEHAGTPMLLGTQRHLAPGPACSLALPCSPLRVTSDSNRDKLLFSGSQAAKGSGTCLVPRQRWRGRCCFLERSKSSSVSSTKG